MIAVNIAIDFDPVLEIAPLIDFFVGIGVEVAAEHVVVPVANFPSGGLSRFVRLERAVFDRRLIGDIVVDSCLDGLELQGFGHWRLVLPAPGLGSKQSQRSQDGGHQPFGGRCAMSNDSLFEGENREYRHCTDSAAQQPDVGMCSPRAGQPNPASGLVRGQIGTAMAVAAGTFGGSKAGEPVRFGKSVTVRRFPADNDRTKSPFETSSIYARFDSQPLESTIGAFQECSVQVSLDRAHSSVG